MPLAGYLLGGFRETNREVSKGLQQWQHWVFRATGDWLMSRAISAPVHQPPHARRGLQSRKTASLPASHGLQYALYRTQSYSSIPRKGGEVQRPGNMAKVWSDSMNLYVAVVNDRHRDPEIEVFATKRQACEWARRLFANSVAHRDGIIEESAPGFELLLSYKYEMDTAYVVERELHDVGDHPDREEQL